MGVGNVDNFKLSANERLLLMTHEDRKTWITKWQSKWEYAEKHHAQTLDKYMHSVQRNVRKVGICFAVCAIEAGMGLSTYGVLNLINGAKNPIISPNTAIIAGA